MSARTYYVHILSGMAYGEPHAYTRDGRPVVAVTRSGDGGVPVQARNRQDAARRFVEQRAPRIGGAS